MQAEARVAIIIPMYNASRFIKQAIDSVKQQTLQDWICIIVDDDSPDDSYMVAKELIADDDRFSLYKKEANGGASSARNFGFRQVPEGIQHLYFLDSDDFIEPHTLATLYSYLDDHPQVGAVGCKYKVVDASTGSMEARFHRRWQPAFLLTRPIPDSQYNTPFATFYCLSGAGSFFLIRRMVFEQTTGYDESLIAFNDVDILCQLSLVAEVHQIPEVLYYKQKHRDSLTYHPFRPEAYKVLRRKWIDLDLPQAQRKVVDRARRHYYHVHLPLVALKTASKALLEAIQMRSKQKATWFTFCLKNAVSLFSSDWKMSEKSELG